jgi:hypothetical protein
MTIETIIRNATNLRHEAQTAALAAELCKLGRFVALCCWCADSAEVRDLPVWRVGRGGDCARCSYSGRDTLVVRIGDNL